jgi:hypothetical protein
MRAWCVFRLSRLQAIVGKAIVDLSNLPKAELLGHEPRLRETRDSRDPVGAALEACREELRYEAGLQEVPTWTTREGMARRHAEHQSPAWVAEFDGVLDRYRHAACRLLQASFAAEPEPF